MPVVTQVRPQAKARGTLSPVWAGVGCLMLVFIGGGSFLASIWLLPLAKKLPTIGGALAQFDAYLKALAGSTIPYMGLGARIGPYFVPAIMALIISVVLYGIIVVLWGFISKPGVDPLDVRDLGPRKKPKRSVRRCR